MRTANLLAVALLAVQPVALAGDDAETLRKAAAQWREVFGSGQQPSVMKRNEAFKDAGLSYQGGLTVPLKSVYSCKSESQLRVLSGMLAHDASYAVMFARKKEFLDTVQFMTSDIGQRVEGIDSLPLPVAVRALRTALAEDITNEETLRKYGEQGRKQLGILIEKAGSDPQTMAMLLDYWYGWSLQGLYVVSSLSQSAEGGEAMVQLLNAETRNTERMDKLYSAVAGTEFARKVSQVDRCDLFRSVAELIRSKQGHLVRKDFKALLAKVQGARAELVNPCTK